MSRSLDQNLGTNSKVSKWRFHNFFLYFLFLKIADPKKCASGKKIQIFRNYEVYFQISRQSKKSDKNKKCKKKSFHKVIHEFNAVYKLKNTISNYMYKTFQQTVWDELLCVTVFCQQSCICSVSSKFQ
jgi:hypothetical protein